MKSQLLEGAASFLNAAGPFLADHEAENTVLLGAVLRCRRKPQSDAVMLVVRDGDALRLVAVITPPHALALSAGDPEAIPYLVKAVNDAGIRPPGVFGGEAMAARFAELWTERAGATTEPASRTILYRARSITPPMNVPGELRRASAPDLQWASCVAAPVCGGSGPERRRIGGRHAGRHGSAPGPR